MHAESPSPDTPASSGTAVLLEFLFRLGRAYLACGEQTAKVETMLRTTAAAYGMRKARIVAFPTAVFIALHDTKGERVTLAESHPQLLRLELGLFQLLFKALYLWLFLGFILVLVGFSVLSVTVAV